MSASNHQILEFSPIIPPLFIMEKTIKYKPNNIELAPNCPRCSSSNTKFCYYNNYSVSQPRYFCKACRRYWTKGGSLRNVPIGGGCRKGRRGRATRQDCPPPSMESKNGPESGGEVDNAAVFNQNAEDYHQSSSFASSDQDVQIEDNTMFGKAVADGNQFGQMGVCIGGDHRQDFVYENFDDFEVEGILGIDDRMWSDGRNLESFGSQQTLMVQQLQEFEVFSSDHDDDQLRLSEDLVCDNWGSFDLSGFENF